MTNSLSVFKFNNQEFNLISYNGQLHMTKGQIALALNYADESQISKLYNAHKDEFTDKMTCLMKQGRTYVRLFSLRGCRMLGFFARTVIAKKFRKELLDFIESFEQNHSNIFSPAVLKILGGLVKKCCRVAVREELGLAQQEIDPERWQAMLNNTALMIELTTDNRVKQKLKSAIEYIEHRN